MEQQLPAVDIRDLLFGWKQREAFLHIPQLSIGSGETIFVEGPSGSGKSTLLSLISGVLSPTAGSVEIFGTDLASLSATKRDALRAERMGVIFQLFNLISYLAPLENVLLPCRFSDNRRMKAGANERERRDQALALMERLGIAHLAKRHETATLSVGQQQRVAAARALIGRPEIILADEPTSSLDRDNRENFLTTLLEESARMGTTVVFVSHDQDLASMFSRRLSLLDYVLSPSASEDVA